MTLNGEIKAARKEQKVAKLKMQGEKSRNLEHQVQNAIQEKELTVIKKKKKYLEFIGS